MNKKMNSCLVAMILLSSGACAETKSVMVQVRDGESGKPMPNVAVECVFVNEGSPWDRVKGPAEQKKLVARADADGCCRFQGESDCGEVWANLGEEIPGYYKPLRSTWGKLDGEGVWTNGCLLLKVDLQRVGNPIPLWVKKIGNDLADNFFKDREKLQFDLLMGEWLPPLGTGAVADIEFVHNPRENLGPVVIDHISAEARRESMTTRFPGKGNGICKVDYPHTACLQIRTAPEDGYVPEVVAVDEYGTDGHNLDWRRSYDMNRCYAFRIRTVYDEQGRIVSACYGKIYGDIHFLHSEDRASVTMFYYLNPTPLDRNLEWNHENLFSYPGYLSGYLP